MKKALSLILALAMVMSLGISAMAITPEGDNGSMDVGANYVAGQNVNKGDIFYVELDWSASTDLKYADGNTTYTWNATTKKYEAVKANGTWTNATISIKVTNSSNVKIEATAAYTDAEGGPVTTVEWTQQSVTLESAAAGISFTDTTKTGEATWDTIKGTVSASGSITGTTAKVGTVSVTITKVEE